MAFEMEVTIGGLSRKLAAEEIAKRPTFQVPALLSGTRQEISTFLLNNHQKSFDGGGATIYYALQPKRGLMKSHKYRIGHVGSDALDAITVLYQAGKYLKEKIGDTVMGGVGSNVELVIANNTQELVEPEKAQQSSSKLLGFSSLVSAVWAK